jgi:serpin B
MKNILLIAIVGVAIAAPLFLFSQEITQKIPYETNQQPSVNDNDSTQVGIQEVVNANNRFAFDLYSELSKSESGNIFYSPYSIFAALAMTYEGAKERTADEIKSVFHFPESEILRPNLAVIYNEINAKNNAYELRTGNALWAQYDYKLIKDYTSRVEKYYGGKVANLDFRTETEKSRQIINSFIEEQTNDKIKELIPVGIIGAATKLVLTNAVYFKGTWELEFDKSDTSDQDFKIDSSAIVKAPMMHMNPKTEKFNYADLKRLQILELPYKGEKISMLILLPKQGEGYDYETGERIFSDYTIKDIELSAEKLSQYKSQMKETTLDSISLPRFEFDTKYSMKDTLSTMGMPTAFTDNADFSGMNGIRELFISAVIHQAYVKVDEQGTEASAATAVVMNKMAAMPRNVFRADHPFIFIIQEKNSGNILFLGRMIDPTK